MPLARRLAEEEDELAVLAMLIDEYYQKLLHAPPESVEPPPRPRPPSDRQDRSDRGRPRRRRGGPRRR